MILSQISDTGPGLVHQLFAVLVIGACCLIIWYCGRWLIRAMSAPPMASTIWDGFFLLVAAVVAINFLLGLIGHSFIKW